MIQITAIGHSGCHHCMKAFEIADKIKKKFRDVKVEKIDVIKHPYIALRHKLLYCPSLVINNKFVFHGIPHEREIFKKIRIGVIG